MKNGNGKLKIESGIPIPTSHGKKGYSEMLRKLKVGESVLLPCTNQSARGLMYQLSRSAKNPCDFEFTGRKIDNDHTRVWRIK